MRLDHTGIVRTAVIAFILVLLAAPPASAHSLNGASASNYRTRITAISAHIPGVDVKVVEVGNRLELSNTTERDVIVLGFKPASENPEPFLRIGPRGVFENLKSPATYASRARLSTSAVPAIARHPEGTPRWRKISNGHSWRWHDHRVHWMLPQPPAAVRKAPGKEHPIITGWELGLVYDGTRKIAVSGDLTWVPGPSKLPWIGLALALGLVTLALGRWRSASSPAGRVLVAAVLIGLSLLDAARLSGVASDSGRSFASAVGSNVQGIAAWVLAAAAGVQTARKGLRAAMPLIGAAGVMFALGSAVDLDVLSHSQIPSTAPAWVSRLGVTAGLGAGLGLAAAAALRLTDPPARSG